MNQNHWQVVGAIAALILILAASGNAEAQTPPPAPTPGEAFVIDVDGTPRAFITVVPSTYTRGSPAVVVLHGGGGSMVGVLGDGSAQSRWALLAERFGFAAIFPNGFNTAENSGLTTDRQSWNDLRPAGDNQVSEQDDAAFLTEVIRTERERLQFDPRAVFVTGSSNGGMMTHRMLIERADLVTAGASFIGSLPEADVPLPDSPTPIMLLNGDLDPLIMFEGGPVGRGGAPVRSTPDSVAYFRRINGVAGGEGRSSVLPDLDPLDATRIVESRFGPEPARVVFYRVVGGGHTIPILREDPAGALPPQLVGPQSFDARGVDLAWAFFDSHMPPPSVDFDASGVVNISDLFAFIDAFTGPTPELRCDFDGSGVANISDLFAYIDAYTGN